MADLKAWSHGVRKANWEILQGYIVRILQHFVTKPCSVTNFKMLFLGVLLDFVFHV